MKVLLDINDNRFCKLLALNELPGQLLGTEKDMTMDIMFSKEDILGRVNALDNDGQIDFSKIDDYGVDIFLESVIDRINHNFDANNGVDWSFVDASIKDSFDAILFEDKMRSDSDDNISLDGLRGALQRYNANGIEASCGPWSIHDGGYDLLWVLSYEGKSLVGCYRSGDHGDLKRQCKFSDKTFSEICDLVQSAYPECRMSVNEQVKMHEQSHAFSK